MIEITPIRLYRLGAICFSIIAMSNTVLFLMNFENFGFFSATSTLANIIFNYALAYFFYYMLKNSQQESLIFENNTDFDNIINKLEKEKKPKKTLN